MSRICILHIGFPKTGSTAIQSFFLKYKKLLAKQNIFFSGENVKHRFLVSIFGVKSSSNKFHIRNGHLTEKQIINYQKKQVEQLDKLLSKNQAKEKDCMFVLSDEGLINKADRLDLDGLKTFLDSRFDDIRIVCYLRDPTKGLISRAQERIKSAGWTYKKACANPPFLPYENLSYFLDTFGHEKFEFRNYDQLVANNTNIVDDFLDLVGSTDMSKYSQDLFLVSETDFYRLIEKNPNLKKKIGFVTAFYFQHFLLFTKGGLPITNMTELKKISNLEFLPREYNTEKIKIGSKVL